MKWFSQLRRGVGTLVTLGAVGTSTVLTAAPVSRPNFILILGEGHGWSSTSVQMDDKIGASKSSFVSTPNLERMAQEGMRFASFYAPSPRCTPSRAAILTGKSPAQLHMTFVGEGRGDNGTKANGRVIAPHASLELPLEETTIAEMLQRAGYATAHYGKWHLGWTDPIRHGFGESDGPTGNGGPNNVDSPHPEELYRMTARGIDFITRQAQAGRPFYLQLSHYASRQGGEATPEARTRVASENTAHTPREIAEAATSRDLDLALGLLLQHLDRLELSKNTYVLFTTDHGSPGRNPPFSGGKGSVWEGGLRVPLLVRGPGVRPGAICHTRTIGEDLFPTLCELAGVQEELPNGLEAGSLAHLLHDQAEGVIQRPREEFVVHFPHYDKDPAGPASALYLGHFKLIHFYETGALRLFNLTLDPAERTDLSQTSADTAKDLDAQLSAYLAAVNAQIPRPNPNPNPSSGPTKSDKPLQRRRK